MTENKRFEICGEGSTNVDVTTYIVEYGDGDDDCFELYESKEDSQKVCDKINNILDENEKLKKQALQLAKVNHENVEKVQSLANKNKQLKQDKQVLMDLYEKYLSNHINISLEFLND